MKIYFVETNGGSEVIFVEENERTAKAYNGAPNGYVDDVDIYATNEDGVLDFESIAENLKNVYEALEAEGNLENYNNMYTSFGTIEFEDGGFQEYLEQAERYQLIFQNNDDSSEVA